MSNLVNAASNLFTRGMKNADQPTITIEPGSSFNVYVTQTIQLGL